MKGSETPSFRALRECIREHGEEFGKFYGMLREYNERFNLTSIIEEEAVFVKHFLDSLAGAHLFPEGARVAEVGSGAGFPSVPLMIARPDLTFTLIESTGKKCVFLETAVKELRLRGIVVNARAEELGHEDGYRERFDVSCARAVARLDTLAEYCMPLVRCGGKFIAYKGESELACGRNALEVLGGGNISEIAYDLPLRYGSRTLVIAEKRRPTPLGYPRGHGAERKSPL